MMLRTLGLLGLLSSTIAAEEPDFNYQIRPILSDKCYGCHGPDEENKKGDLRLDNSKDAYAVISPGKPDASEAWHRILSDDPDEVMPPPESNLKLTAEEKQLLKRWIEEGAKYEKHWAFKSLPKTIEVPNKKTKTEAIDQFIQAKFSEGVDFNPSADPYILARRASMVLTGLPTKQELASKYLTNPTKENYVAYVDQLLATPACAEHLAVHWMDYSRFADSYGFQVDRMRDMSAWRDWVISAFDQNMPYDQFITWQLAGDLIPNPSHDSILATAFNRHHQQKVEGGSIPEEFRVEYVADRTHTTGTVMMGLTFECARCHDHKYDAISQKDYYRMFSFFNNIDEAGLYSFFTSATPTPTLRLGGESHQQAKAKAREELKIEQDKLEVLKRKGQVKVDSIQLPKPIAHYSFDDLKAGMKNTVSDNYHARGQASAIAGSKNGAIQLSGDHDIRLGDLGPVDRSEPISIRASLMLEESYKRAVVWHRSKAWTDAASRGYELLIEDGRLSFAFIHFYPGNAIRVKAKEKLPIQTWQDVTVTYDGSSQAKGLKIYVNGEAQDTEVVRDQLTKEIYYDKNKKDKVPFIIGARMRDRGFKKGGVDELSYYTIELSSAEVKALYDNNATDLKKDREHLITRYDSNYQVQLELVKKKRQALNELLNKEQEIMVMQEMPQPRDTYVLTRGLYNLPDKSKQVYAAGPEAVLPYGEQYPRNRYGLAQWLTSRENPLTSRVAINRIWAMVFGKGLVQTPDDFGNQGHLPTHPKLLDWLAVEFMDSGWDMKHMLKLMVTSGAFMQSSKINSEKYMADSNNDFYSYGPRRRLSAEQIRDQALAVSGQLSHKVGGRSENATNSKRRALYLQWKRNAPPPSMLIFDASRRQVCSVKRETTSTPLQALVLLNRDLYVEASKNLAYQLVTQEKDSNVVLNKIFEKLTGRKPDQKEKEICMSAYEDQVNLFKQNEARLATFLKGRKFKTLSEGRSWAAWSMVANLVMNHDDSITLR